MKMGCQASKKEYGRELLMKSCRLDRKNKYGKLSLLLPFLKSGRNISTVLGIHRQFVTGVVR